MRRSRFTEEQIVAALRQAEAGPPARNRMPRAFLVVLVILLLAPAHSVRADWRADADAHLGYRMLGDDDLWVGSDAQFATTITVDFGRDDWPVGIAAGFGVSEGGQCEGFLFACDRVLREGKLTEWSLGARKTWSYGEGKSGVYLGGGLLTMKAKVSKAGSRPGPEGRDRSPGASLELGFFWRFGLGLRFGLHVRAVTMSDLSIDGVDGDADSITPGFFVGMGFPPG